MKFNKGKGLPSLVKPLVAATAVGVAGYALAVTDAGTVIKNLATVSYTDVNGDSYTATSNEAQVVVSNVFSATLEADNQDVNGAPGQTVYFPHVLTNSGNASDTYTILFGDDDLTGALGDTTAGGFTAYLDENGNGQPDAGEAVITDGGTITLEPGEEASIILAVDIPATADAGDLIDAAIVVQSAGGGDVEDIGDDLDGDIADAGSALGAVDVLDGTNQNLVTVTLGAVLVSTKSSEFILDDDAGTAGNQSAIEYTLTVKNVGGADATDVDIFDAIPASTAGITFNRISEVNGLLNGTDSWFEDGVGYNTNLGTLASITTTDDFDEPYDINDNGAVDTGVDAILFRDEVLGANVTVSIKYVIRVPASAGDVYKNIFCAGQDIAAGASATTFDFDAADIAQCSNETIDPVPFTYGVTISDNLANDGTNDDVENVTTPAGTGSNVDFTNIVTNTGTDNDIFDLEVVGDAFPAGTVFTFWEDGAVVPLTDNNNNGIPDTGVVGAGSSVNIVVRATLPQEIEDGDAVTAAGGTNITGGTIDTDSVSGNLYLEKATADQQVAGGDATENTADGYDVTVASTSDDDEKFQVVIRATSSEDASQSDETIDALGSIALPEVDLANANNANGFGVAGTDAHASGATITTIGNGTVNDDGDAATVDAISGNGASTDEAVEVGQTVYFPLFIANEGPNLDAYELTHDYTGTDFIVSFKEDNTAEAEVITATPALSQGETFPYYAEITTTDGSPSGTQTFEFTVTSPTSGATDSKTDAIVVALNCEQGITPASQQQIQAGGNVDYVHTFTNNSNATQTFTFDIALSDAAWSSLLITVSDDSATFAADDVIDDAATVTLTAGQSISFINRVFAPANAIASQTEVSTVTLSSNLACGDAVVEDVASVIVGQVRLTKQVTVDDECDCDSSNDPAFQNDGGQVEPGACAIWQLTATNEGDEDAASVVINDSLTEFTTFVSTAAYVTTLPGSNGAGTDTSLRACKDTGCDITLAAADIDITAVPVTTADGVTVNVVGETVTFTAGTLIPGNSVTGQFCVQVQ